jgi:sulfide:quinone oxidoreductase
LVSSGSVPLSALQAGHDPSAALGLLVKVGLERPTRSKNIALIKDRGREVDPDAKRVATEGRKLSFDYLVVATGADMRPEELPGLAEHAETIWTPREITI